MESIEAETQTNIELYDVDVLSIRMISVKSD